MNSREPVHSFEAARRQHLIDATIEALADVGFKAASLSQIAQRANVSTGLFAHYFGDKDGLLEATLRFMAVRLARAMRQRLEAAHDARERLYAVPDSALADEEFNRRTSAVWLAFWGQITHSVRYQRIQLIYQQRMLSNLRHDLRPLVPADRVERYATMIASMIDGVWIRSHASSQQADAAKARALVRALIDELIAGVVRDGAIGADEGGADAAPAGTARPVAAPPRRSGLGRSAASIDGACATAIARAEAARRTWTGLPARRRAQALRATADALSRDAEALAAMEAREMGRAVAVTRAHTLPRAVGLLRQAADNVRDRTVLYEDLGLGGGLERHDGPLGIVVAAGRWSSPLLDAVRHGAPALAAGNAVIFQAPRRAPGSCARFAALLEECGVPAGVFQPLGDNADLERALRARPDVTTQAPPIEQAATIVLDGAEAAAARTILQASSPWRLSPDYSETHIFVTRDSAPMTIAALRAQAAAIRAGDPLDPSTRLGRPMSCDHAADVARSIAEAVRAGAELLATPGADPMAGPTIVDVTGCDGPAFSLPLHAPVVALAIVADDEDLLRWLQAPGRSAFAAIGLIGPDDRRARRIIEAARVPFGCIAGTNRAGAPAEDAGPWADSLRFAAADRRRHCVYIA